MVTVSVPIRPIYEKVDLHPSWNEVLLMVWVTGVLVNEITNHTMRTKISKVDLCYKKLNQLNYPKTLIVIIKRLY